MTQVHRVLMRNVKTSQQVAESTKRLLHKRYMEKKRVWGYRWGFAELDMLTGGVQWEDTREMTIVGARSAGGKSAFALTVGLGIAYQFKEKWPGLEVRIILLEMSAEACFMRLVGQMAEVDLMDMRSGFISPEELRRVDAAIASLSQLPITWIVGSHTMDSIEQLVKGDLGTDRECGYWIVDHIGIVPTGAAMNSGNTSFAIGTVSARLHQITMEVAPSMILTQLNRESLNRKDPTPNIGDIYGSDRIMQDADNVLLLDRPETRILRPADEIVEEEVAFIIIGKTRDSPGQGRKLEVMYYPKRVLWSDIEQDSGVSNNRGIA